MSLRPTYTHLISTHLAFIVAIAILVTIPSAQAAIVVFRFEGTVTDVPIELASEFNVGERIRGSYSFESTSLPNINGDFTLSVLTFEGMVGDYKFVQSGLGDIALTGGYTVVGFTQANNVGSRAAFLHAIQLLGGSLPSGVLPLQPPDLTQFSDRLFTLDYIGGGANPRLTGQIDSISIVPEPSALFALYMLVVAPVSLLRRVRLAAPLASYV